MSLQPVLVHQLFGVLVLAFAGLLLARETGLLRGRWTDYLPASALLLGGGLLFADPWLFHGGDFGSEGRQHTWQGATVVVAGALEWARVKRYPARWELLLVVPLVLAGLGLGFLRHQQHASGDMLLQSVQHRVMGATLLITALVKLAANLRWRDGQWARAGWALILVVFAWQLILYAETGDHAGHRAGGSVVE